MSGYIRQVFRRLAGSSRRQENTAGNIDPGRTMYFPPRVLLSAQSGYTATDSAPVCGYVYVTSRNGRGLEYTRG